jgi:hypothetical protein
MSVVLLSRLRVRPGRYALIAGAYDFAYGRAGGCGENIHARDVILRRNGRDGAAATRR